MGSSLHSLRSEWKMQNRSYNAQLRELALGTAWSLWAELGVSGWERRHSLTAIDLEPLIVASSYLADADARLMEESLDWCISNSEVVSAVRLRNHLSAAHPLAKGAFGRFASTVKQHARVNWPGRGKPRKYSPTRRSSVPQLDRPALLQLRLRALWGVSARAEILRIMLPEGGRLMGVAEIAQAAAYSKDNVADALEPMHRGGLLDAAMVGNQRVYRLVKQYEVSQLVGLQPTEFPDWTARFRLTLSFLELAESAPSKPLARAAAIRRGFRGWGSDLARVGLVLPNLASDEALLGDFEGWSLRVLRQWSGAEADAPAVGPTSYSVHRLETGSWLGTIDEPGGASRPIQMPEWAGLYHEAPRSDMIIADDSSGAPRLAHAMFEDAFRRVNVKIGPYWSADPANQIISREFAEQWLWPIRKGGSANFDDASLRAWYTGRRSRLGSTP